MNKWEDVKLYKVNDEVKKFYDKLTSKTIEILDGDENYIYQTSNGNEWTLQNIDKINDVDSGIVFSDGTKQTSSAGVIPQNYQPFNNDYYLQLSDIGKHIYMDKNQLEIFDGIDDSILIVDSYPLKISNIKKSLKFQKKLSSNQKRIFISGAAGVIGTEMVDILLKQGAILFVGDLKPCPEKWYNKLYYGENYEYFEI